MESITIPPSMFMEMGSELIKSRSASVIQRQLKELNTFGPARFSQFVCNIIHMKDGLNAISDREAGYLLGLETFRAMYSNVMENKDEESSG